MSTTSPNFNLVLATTGDVVNVVTQVANNFSTLDALLSIAHTGTGALKAGLTFTTPTLQSPSISGTASGAGIVIASTGLFSTITATGGAVTVNTFSIGTYSYPTTASANSTILTVVTGNAVWAASAPNTGANQALSNLSTVAFNTSLNTFTGGFATVDRVIATSGALTGLTVFQATTGTFASNVTISGTATINAVNCTGGMGTFAGITIGTWALPTTLGAATQVLYTTGGTAGWFTPVILVAPATASGTTYIIATATFGAAGSGGLIQMFTPVVRSGTYALTVTATAFNGAASGTGTLYINTTAQANYTFTTNTTVTTNYSLAIGDLLQGSFSGINNGGLVAATIAVSNPLIMTKP